MDIKVSTASKEEIKKLENEGKVQAEKLIYANSIQIMPGVHVSKPLSEADVQSIKKALIQSPPSQVTPLDINYKFTEADKDVFISKQPQDGVHGDMLINNPEPVFNDPGKALGVFEVIRMLKTVEADVFILNIPPGLHDSTRAHIEEKLNHIWEIYDIRTPILMLPDYARLVGCKNFSFHEALELLKAGFKVQRSKWGSGYLYMTDSIIYHSNDNKEWKPTQKHILATNWQLF